MSDRRECIARLAIVALALGTSVAQADPYSLSDHDNALVKLALSERMLDPASTIVSDVVAVTKGKFDETGATVCGLVRGKNGFGGYAQPTPFIGILADTTSGARTFLPIAIADSSSASQISVLQTCRSAIEAGSKPHLSTLTQPIHAEDWDDCLRKLCISTEQGDCWVKLGASICDDGGRCVAVHEHTPAIIGEKRGSDWHVRTKAMDGWVSDRMMMMTGGRCSIP